MNDDGRLDFGLLTKGLGVAAIPGICLGPGGGGGGGLHRKMGGDGPGITRSCFTARLTPSNFSV